MSGPIPERLTSEEAHLQMALRELGDLIRGGFVGTLRLDCPGDGTMRRAHVEMVARPGDGTLARVGAALAKR